MCRAGAVHSSKGQLPSAGRFSDRNVPEEESVQTGYGTLMSVKSVQTDAARRRSEATSRSIHLWLYTDELPLKWPPVQLQLL